MSVVLRLKPGDAAVQSALLADEAPPEAFPPPEPALLDWAALTPTVDSHLAPCPHCGLPNGLSASSCWSCEARLFPLERARRGHAPWLAAPAPTDAHACADTQFPVLTSAVDGDAPMTDFAMATVLASEAAPAAGWRRHARGIGASILVVAASAGAVFLYVDDMQEHAALASARPAPTALATVVDAGNAPPVVAETQPDALRALAVEPSPQTAAQAAQTAAPAALAAAPAGRPRSTSRPPKAAPLAAPKADMPDPSWQPPAPVRAACTPTVAALGLCAAPPIESKE